MSRREWAHNVIATLLIVVLALANMLVQAGIWRPVTMSIDMVLYILAVVAFLLAAFSVTVRGVAIGWRDVGFALLVLTLIIN